MTDLSMILYWTTYHIRSVMASMLFGFFHKEDTVRSTVMGCCEPDGSSTEQLIALPLFILSWFQLLLKSI